jgi:hypothetical protein
MILTPSEVASLSASLSFWEIGEYISEALVALACFGEYVASFTTWFTKGDRDRQKRLEKRSTLLLIFALSSGLLCLVQTNELSGRVIGSLGEQAEKANEKARLAIELSDTAVTKSGQAVSASGNALLKSGKAEGAASNALALARGARKEADSFEQEIVSAKQKAADAESHLAEALKRAAKAEIAAGKLTEKMADRQLTDAQVQRIGDTLKPFAGQEYDVMTYWDTPECGAISNRIYTALRIAYWKNIPSKAIGLLRGITGVMVYVHASPSSERIRLAADMLVSVLNTEGITARLKLMGPGNDPPANRISLSIGTKN